VQRSLFYITDKRFLQYIKHPFYHYVFIAHKEAKKEMKKFVKDKYFSNLAEI
jgi:hypothetical protein